MSSVQEIGDERSRFRCNAQNCAASLRFLALQDPLEKYNLGDPALKKERPVRSLRAPGTVRGHL